MSLYERLWADLLQPGFDRLRGRLTPELERRLSLSQWSAPDELEHWRWRELEPLLRHARQEVPFYQDWFRQSGLGVEDILAARDLTLLPLIGRAQLMAEPKRFRAQRPPAGSFAKSTGGTSGSPLHFMVNPASDQWRWAVTHRGYAWAGCRPGGRQAHLWSGDLVPLPPRARLKRELHRRLQRMRYIDCFHLGQAELDQALGLIAGFKPRTLVAFTSAAEILARHAIKRGFSPPASLRAIITGAESLHPHQRQLLQKAFGCPVFETYGSREFMLIAAECENHQGLHISAENLMLEIIKDGRPAPPGQVGQVTITDLHNYAQPFIRYQSGDLAVAASGACACGRGLPRLERLEGRILEILRAPGGQELTGTFFPHLLKDFPAIVGYQAEQDRSDHLTLRLVLEGELPAGQRARILDLVGQALPGVEPQIVEVDQIPRTAAGKVRVTIGLDSSLAGRAA